MHWPFSLVVDRYNLISPYLFTALDKTIFCMSWYLTSSSRLDKTTFPVLRVIFCKCAWLHFQFIGPNGCRLDPFTFYDSFVRLYTCIYHRELNAIIHDIKDMKYPLFDGLDKCETNKSILSGRRNEKLQELSMEALLRLCKSPGHMNRKYHRMMQWWCICTNSRPLSSMLL